ncbi:putative tyrosine-protein kinase [Apostichopus japonicus]|uniref:Putative tyrosine-protein kinase n=1 Tax=Stichopus japonicus TaxID=307972 RepID=A0A2G8KT99_STIJA|nr:putative tyrosine-protein kinase [Apostichopus japonicus]
MHIRGKNCVAVEVWYRCLCSRNYIQFLTRKTDTDPERLSALSERLNTLQDNISQKENDLRILDEEIRHIPPESNTETAVLDLLTKQKDYQDLSLEILNLKSHKAKVEQQLSCLQEKFQGINPDQLPLGIDLKDQQSLGPIPQTLLFNRMLLMLSNLQQRCLCLQPSSNKDVPLEDEAWYHGALPRQETEELLKQEGDFIARFKSDAPASTCSPAGPPINRGSTRS